MRKGLISLCVIALLLSCGKIDTLKESNEIKFQNELITKSDKGIVDGTDFTYSNFGIYGYVSDNDSETGTDVSSGYLFKNAKYVDDGTGVWIPDADKHYYWPKADNKDDIHVNFVAYTPYNASPSWSSDVLTINLDGTNLDGDCVDYLYATKTNVHPTNSPVSLTFNHALAWLEFQAKKAPEVKAVTITSIKFSSKLYGQSALQINTKTAVVTPGSASGQMADFVNFAQRNTTLTTSYAVLSDMLLVPQNVPTQVTITFDITLENESGDEIVYHGRTITKIVNTGKDMNNTDYVASFQSGNKYVYRVYVTVDEVIFEADVNTWDDSNIFQVWDHTADAYVDHFFDKASMLMVKNSVIA